MVKSVNSNSNINFSSFPQTEENEPSLPPVSLPSVDFDKFDLNSTEHINLLATTISPQACNSKYGNSSPSMVFQNFSSFIENSNFLEYCELSSESCNIAKIQTALKQLTNYLSNSAISATELKERLSKLNLNEFLCITIGQTNEKFEYFRIIKFTKDGPDTFSLQIFSPLDSDPSFQGAQISRYKKSLYPYIEFSKVPNTELFQLDLIILQNILNSHQAKEDINTLLAYLLPLSKYQKLDLGELSEPDIKAFKYLISTRSSCKVVKSLTALVLELTGDKANCRKLVIGSRFFLILKSYYALSNNLNLVDVNQQLLVINILNLSCESLCRMVCQHHQIYSSEKFTQLSAALIELKKLINVITPKNVIKPVGSSYRICPMDLDDRTERVKYMMNNGRHFKTELIPPDLLESPIVDVDEAIKTYLGNPLRRSYTFHYDLSNNKDLSWENLPEKLGYLAQYFKQYNVTFNSLSLLDNFTIAAQKLIEKPISDNLKHKELNEALIDIASILFKLNPFNESAWTSTLKAELTLIAYHLTIKADSIRELTLNSGNLKSFTFAFDEPLFNFDYRFNLFASKDRLRRSIEVQNKLNEIFKSEAGKKRIFEKTDRSVDSAEVMYLESILPSGCLDFNNNDHIRALNNFVNGNDRFVVKIITEKLAVTYDKASHEIYHLNIFRNILSNLGKIDSRKEVNTFNENQSIASEVAKNISLIKEACLSRNRADQLISNLISEIVNDPLILLDGTTYLLRIIYQSLPDPFDNQLQTTPIVFAVANDPAILQKVSKLEAALEVLEQKMIFSDKTDKHLHDAYIFILKLKCAILAEYQSLNFNESSQTCKSNFETLLPNQYNSILDRLTKINKNCELSDLTKANLPILKAQVLLLQYRLSKNIDLMASAFVELARQLSYRQLEKKAHNAADLLIYSYTWQIYLEELHTMSNDDLISVATKSLEQLGHTVDPLNFKVQQKKLLCNEWEIDFCHAIIKQNRCSLFSEQTTINTDEFKSILKNSKIKPVYNGSVYECTPKNLGPITIYIDKYNIASILEKKIAGQRYFKVATYKFLFSVEQYIHWVAADNFETRMWLQDKFTGEFKYKVSDKGVITSATDNSVVSLSWRSLDEKASFIEVFHRLDEETNIIYSYSDKSQTLEYYRLKSPESSDNLKLTYLEDSNCWVLADNPSLKVDFDYQNSEIKTFLPLKSLDNQRQYLLLPRTEGIKNSTFEKIAENSHHSFTSLMKIEVIGDQLIAGTPQGILIRKI